jgi:hypothetical protein
LFDSFARLSDCLVELQEFKIKEKALLSMIGTTLVKFLLSHMLNEQLEATEGPLLKHHFMVVLDHLT